VPGLIAGAEGLGLLRRCVVNFHAKYSVNFAEEIICKIRDSFSVWNEAVTNYFCRKGLTDFIKGSVSAGGEQPERPCCLRSN
jgi:hypothetical protein